ncbi:hypothetical protein LJC34_03775, partial [Oscillospiraceae bacterium OttesenSCG-928-G22]|nr:hypothetical protein [Oscillospiraceae bacterium OttesenSCG-928-G22]
ADDESDEPQLFLDAIRLVAKGYSLPDGEALVEQAAKKMETTVKEPPRKNDTVTEVLRLIWSLTEAATTLDDSQERETLIQTAEYISDFYEYEIKQYGG